MRKFIKVLLLTAMLLSLIACDKSEGSDAESPPPEESSAPEYGSAGTVTILGDEYDIATTTELDLSWKAITDEQLKEIAPQIEQLTGLTKLNLSYNIITDISPLTKLTGLTGLDLSGNDEITDILPLAKFTGLTDLNLYLNKITDISPLAKLTGLTRLDLSYNEITDISLLAKLTGLADLHLDGNKITDISPLKNLLGLTYLSLYDNPIKAEDIAQLTEQLPNCDIYF